MLFLLLACTQDKEANTAPLTYYADIQPIMEKNCLRCHLGNGPGVGDFSNPEDIEIFADLILSAIDDGSMPPPAADPECRDYIGSESMVVTEEDRNIIAQWIEDGKVIGEPSEATPIDLNQYTLEDADLEVLMPEPYTPEYTKPEDLNNEYRCFVMEHGRDENFYIEALHPKIDNAEIVHHVVLAKVPRDELIEGADAPEGRDCIGGALDLLGGGSGSIDSMIAAWAPGAAPIVFEDAGMLVRPDEVFVIQMHYYKGGSADGVTDQSGYMLKTTDAVEKTVMMAPFGSQGFTIPAGDPEYTYGQGFSLPADITIWATFPHMHLLGTGYHMTITREDSDEEECVVQSDKYDFNNQLTYQFNKPIEVNEGDRIYFECTWDNSADNPNAYYDPPQDVYYGERTDEEMCFAFTLISIGH